MPNAPRKTRRNPDKSAYKNPPQPHLTEWNDPTANTAIANILREQDQTPRWHTTRPAEAINPKLIAVEMNVVRALFGVRELTKAEACIALVGRVAPSAVLNAIDDLIALGELEATK